MTMHMGYHKRNLTSMHKNYWSDFDGIILDAVRQIIAVNDPAVDSKSASTSSKTFDSIYEILQLKDELSSRKKILLDKFDCLSSLRDELKNDRSANIIFESNWN